MYTVSQRAVIILFTSIIICIIVIRANAKYKVWPKMGISKHIGIPHQFGTKILEFTQLLDVIDISVCLLLNTSACGVAE
jgi:hypothetical protein